MDSLPVELLRVDWFDAVTRAIGRTRFDSRDAIS
jgi:hypothetical protein